MKSLLNPLDAIIEGVRETVLGIPLWFLIIFISFHAGWLLAIWDTHDSLSSYSISGMISLVAMFWMGALVSTVLFGLTVGLLIGLTVYIYSKRYRTESLLLTFLSAMWYTIFVYRKEPFLSFSSKPFDFGFGGLIAAILITGLIGLLCLFKNLSRDN